MRDDRYHVEKLVDGEWVAWSDAYDYPRASLLLALARKYGYTARIVDAFGQEVGL